MDLYDRLARNFAERKKIKEEKALSFTRGKRPLKMPKGYDFSVRNVNWSEYKNDFILRTDAVWEKQKLKDHFYVMYKQFFYDKTNNAYMVSDFRITPLPTNYGEHMLQWAPFKGFAQDDGLIWCIKTGPAVFSTPSFSHFICDKEGDAWYSCFVSFQKFMKCNERSEVRLDEANLHNNGFEDYECFDDLDNLFHQCGPDLFENMYEVYKHRLRGNVDKPQSFNRAQLFKDTMNTVSDRKSLHY